MIAVYVYTQMSKSVQDATRLLKNIIAKISKQVVRFCDCRVCLYTNEQKRTRCDEIFSIIVDFHSASPYLQLRFYRNIKLFEFIFKIKFFIFANCPEVSFCYV